MGHPNGIPVVTCIAGETGRGYGERGSRIFLPLSPFPELMISPQGVWVPGTPVIGHVTK